MKHEMAYKIPTTACQMEGEGMNPDDILVIDGLLLMILILIGHDINKGINRIIDAINKKKDDK